MPDLIHDALVQLRRLGSAEDRQQSQIADIIRTQKRQGIATLRRVLALAVLVAGLWFTPVETLFSGLSAGQWLLLVSAALCLVWP